MACAHVDLPAPDGPTSTIRAGSGSPSDIPRVWHGDPSVGSLIVDGFIAWCGFLGAWLLFAGPVFQAALELREQEIERDRIAAAMATVPKPPPVSNWWWLLPPVHYVLTRRRSDTYRNAVWAALDAEDVAALVLFSSKAVGWALVGLGGLLLALKETWELREHYEWPTAIFWLLIVLMGALSVAITAGSQGRGQKLLKSI